MSLSSFHQRTAKKA